MLQLINGKLPDDIRSQLRGHHLIFIFDTSGSVLFHLTPRLRDEMLGLVEDLGYPGLFLYVDTCVRGYQFVAPGQRVDFTLVGGGGTDYSPGFMFIAAERLYPNGVVYFTDGEGMDFPPKPPYRVDWIQVGTAPFRPLFGRILRLKTM